MDSSLFRKVWSYRPVDYRTWPSLSEPQIQTVTIRSGLDASAIKLYFTNKNGITSLRLTDLNFSIFRSNKNVFKSKILFDKINDLKLAIDENKISDAIKCSIQRDDLLQIQITLPQKCYLTSGVVTYSLLNLKVENKLLKTGSPLPQIDCYKMVQDNPRMTYFFGFYGIGMLNNDSIKVITVFGDSIVQQGFFVNHLRKDLQAVSPNHFSVNNCGIGGNRVLFDTDPVMDKWYRHGIAGVHRFERDVYNEAEPNVVLVFHGINDLIQETAHPGESEDVDEVIEGLKEYANIIKRHHSKAVIGTLLPLGNSRFYSESVERKRQLLNQWIRTQNIYNQVIDLERAVVSNENSINLRNDCDSGDGLHPNDYGGSLLAHIVTKAFLE